jgi:hypothetical protein
MNTLDRAESYLLELARGANHPADRKALQRAGVTELYPKVVAAKTKAPKVSFQGLDSKRKLEKLALGGAYAGIRLIG